jgi:predicted DCC family thiol-disulfide oxidoreductase YuxK
MFGVLAQPGIVLFDGDCPLCKKSVSILKRLDWLSALRFHNARDTANLPESKVVLNPQKLLDEMHLLTPDRKHAHAGYDAFRWIAWRIPLAWLVAPLMSFPGVPEVGNQIYRWIAKNRFKLVPCDDGGCKVNLKKSVRSPDLA